MYLFKTRTVSVYRGGPVDRRVNFLVLTDSDGPGSKSLEENIFVTSFFFLFF